MVNRVYSDACRLLYHEFCAYRDKLIIKYHINEDEYNIRQQVIIADLKGTGITEAEVAEILHQSSRSVRYSTEILVNSGWIKRETDGRFWMGDVLRETGLYFEINDILIDEFLDTAKKIMKIHHQTG